jgi:hypothetical protein
MDGPVELVNNQDPIEFIARKKTIKRTGKNKRKSRKIKRKIIKRNKINPKKTNRRKRNRKNKRRTM